MSSTAVPDTKVYAPKVIPQVLWQMTNEDFFKWRRDNDYPRIVSFLRKKLLDFDEWMTSQEISVDLLIKYSPSSFLREEALLYLYTFTDSNFKERETLVSEKYNQKRKLVSEEKLKEEKHIVPYPIWYTKVKKKKPLQLYVNYRSGRSCFLLYELELLDLGNCHLTNMFFSGRQLDFVNISDFRISNCSNNSLFKLWFSSAVNISFEGDFAFIDAYKTSFYEVFHLKYQNLKLSNGRFQSWSFSDCNLNLTATNAIIHRWEFLDWDFEGTMSNTDIKDCNFKDSNVEYPIGYGRAMNFHSQLKRLYSQIGRKKEASQHYYLEKTYERKTFLHVKANYQNIFYRSQTTTSKTMLRLKYFLKYIYSGFLNLLWGYSERPSRVFIISIFTIFVFSVLYCFLPSSSPDTHNNFGNSLYFSMVTFTTLGYGDISQKIILLKLLSGLEAIMGMSFWGILIAGFTSNSKDY